MMSVWFILKYEMKKFFREKTSILFILIPMGIFPITMGFMNTGQLLLSDMNRTNTVAMIKAVPEDNSLDNIILHQKGYTYRSYESIQKACLDLKKGRITGIIYMKARENAEDSRLHFIYDPNSMESLNFLQTFSKKMQNAQKNILDDLEKRYAVSDIDVSYTAESYTAYMGTPLNDIVVSILPVILITFALFSGSAIATDTITGEKERGTFEDLLLVNPSFSAVICAKTLFVYIVLLFETLSAVIGFGITALCGGLFSSALQLDFLSGVSLSVVFRMILMMNIFILCVSAFMVYLGILSRNVRGANLKLNILSLIPCFFSFFLLYFNAENCPDILYGIPIINIMVAVKFLLMQTLGMSSYFIVNAANLLYLFILVLAAKKALLSEKNII